jgi:hypothetical protein
MSDLKSFAGRLNYALDQLPPESRPPEKGRGRQAFVAKMFRVSQKGARKWLEGEALPRTTRLAAIARRCGVNGEWLLTGQGPMRGTGTAGDEETGRIAVAEPPQKYRIASARTRRLIARLSEAEHNGRLSDADIAALEGIVQRLIARN